MYTNTCLALSASEIGTGSRGLIRAPHKVVCRIMQAQIEKVNFQSQVLIKQPMRGAKTNDPTPLPAIVMPVATPRFLSKYSAMTMSEAMYVQPVERPPMKPYVINMAHTFGPNTVSMYMAAVTTPPPITTARQPNWFARPATIGPRTQKLISN